MNNFPTLLRNHTYLHWSDSTAFASLYIRLDVEHIYRLEPIMRSGGKHRFYITRPDMLAVSQISEHIQSDNKAREYREYKIIFVPRKLTACEFILEREGVYGFVKILEWTNLHLIPLDEHLLSLEQHNTLQSLYLDKDYTMLHTVAHSIIMLEEIYGTIPVVHGKGHLADNVWQLVDRLKDAKKDPTVLKPGGPGITELILFDRQCDLVTPLCSQLTYEGILDDTFGIKSGYVEFDKALTGKNVKVLLNANDPVYSQTRALHFSAVPRILSHISRQLQYSYDEGRSSQSIPELKTFVKRLPELRKKHDSLATHLKVSEQILARKRAGEFQKQLLYERGVLEGADKIQIADYIEECIHRQLNFRIPLRLLCLMSTINNGIKAKYLMPLKQQYLHSYGYKHLVTFHNLQKLGLLQEKAEEPVGVGQAPRNTFKQLSRLLKLVPKDPGFYDVQARKDMAYVFGGAYKPLSCAAVEYVVRNGTWKGLDDVVKSWHGSVFSHEQSSRMSTRREAVVSVPSQRTVLVYFIGGCTFSEISALQFLSETTQCRYIVATTNILNHISLIDSLVVKQ